MPLPTLFGFGCTPFRGGGGVVRDFPGERMAESGENHHDSHDTDDHSVDSDDVKQAVGRGGDEAHSGDAESIQSVASAGGAHRLGDGATFGAGDDVDSKVNCNSLNADRADSAVGFSAILVVHDPA